MNRTTSPPRTAAPIVPRPTGRTSSTVAVAGAGVFARAVLVMTVGFAGLAAALLGAGTALRRTLRGRAAAAGSGLVLLAAALRRQDGTAHLAHLAVPTRWAATASLLLMVWFGSGAYGENGGLVQRALLLLAVGWPVLLAVRVPLSGPRPGPRPGR